MATTYTYNVTGMTCGSCVAYLESNIGKLPNIDSVSVSLMLNKAEIKTKPGREDELLEAITKCGFKPAFVSAQQDGEGAAANPRKPLGLKKQPQRAVMMMPLESDDDDDDDNNNDIVTPNQETHSDDGGKPADFLPPTTPTSQQLLDDFDEFTSNLDTSFTTSATLESALGDTDVKGLLDEFDAILSSVPELTTSKALLSPLKEATNLSSLRKLALPLNAMNAGFDDDCTGFVVDLPNQVSEVEKQPELQPEQQQAAPKGSCCGGKGKKHTEEQQEDEVNASQQQPEDPEQPAPSAPKGSCCGGKSKVPSPPLELADTGFEAVNDDTDIDFDDFSAFDGAEESTFLPTDFAEAFSPTSQQPESTQYDFEIAPVEKPKGSCCGGKGKQPSVQEDIQLEQPEQQLEQQLEQQPQQAAPKGSCCGGKGKKVDQGEVTAEVSNQQEQQEQQSFSLGLDLLRDFEGSSDLFESGPHDTTQDSPQHQLPQQPEPIQEKPKGSCCGGKGKQVGVVVAASPILTATPSDNDTQPTKNNRPNNDGYNSNHNDFLGDFGLSLSHQASNVSTAPLGDDFLNILGGMGTPTVLTPAGSEVVLGQVYSDLSRKNNTSDSSIEQTPQVVTARDNNDDDFTFEFNDPQAKLDRVAEFDPLQGFASLHSEPVLSTTLREHGEEQQQQSKDAKPAGGCCGGKKAAAPELEIAVSVPPASSNNDVEDAINDVFNTLDSNPTPTTQSPSQSPAPSNNTSPRAGSDTTQQQPPSSSSSSTHVFNVTGMTCGGCVAFLESKIRALPTVETVSVSLLLNKAEIKASNTQEELFDVIKAAGFVPTFISTNDGSKKRISRSAQTNERGLKTPAQRLNESRSESPSVDGDQTTSLSNVPSGAGTSTALVSRSQQRQQQQQQRQSNNSCNDANPVTGTAADTISKRARSKAKKIRMETPSEKLAKQAYAWWTRLQIALAFGIPIFFIAMILPLNETANMILMTPLVNSATVMGLVLFILATPVQFGVGRIFLQNALQALKSGHSNMSVLIAIGSLSAYLYSFVSLALNFFEFNDSPYASGGMREHFFETSSTLITVVIFGQYLEHVAKGHTSSALSKLMSLQPSTATIVDITAAGLGKIASLSLRNNQTDDELFQSIQCYIPSFSYHYNSSSFSLDTAKESNSMSKDMTAVVVGGTTTMLTATQKYKFDNILHTAGITHLDMLDDTQDVNKYIVQNSTRSVDTEDLEEGQYVKILRGSKIPADCMVVFGTCYIDDSVVTGESIQRKKVPGSTLIAGTVVMEGVCIAMVLRSGDDTTLSQIVTLVEQAQISKAPISAFADQISLYFVPTIIALSILTLVVWYFIGSQFGVIYSRVNQDTGATETLSVLTHAVIRAVAVVVIACPCALGLATPTAVMVATGVGAKHGVLIKGGAALEAAANIDTVVFDKTGTITRGKPQVVCSMLFSPKVGSLSGQPNHDGLSTRTGNNQHLLKLMKALMPTHLFMVGDEIQTEHYAGIVKSSIESSINNGSAGEVKKDTKHGFGQINIHPSESTRPSMHLFPQGNTDSEMSVGLNQLLRVLFTLVSLAESNTEHFLGACLSKYSKSLVLSYGEELLSHKGKAQSSKSGQTQFQHMLELNEGYFSMSHVINQTGRGVKCDIAVPLSFLPVLGSNNGDVFGQSQPMQKGITLASVVVGNANWLIENKVYIPPVIASIAIQLESQGLTVIFSSIQGQLIGLYAIGDEIKPEAFEVIDYLQRVMQYKIFVLTGDNVRNAKFLASRLNIPHNNVYAHLSPAQKLNIIQQLQIHGKVISATNSLPITPQAQRAQQEHLIESQKFKLADVVHYIPIVGHLVRFVNNAEDKTGVNDMGDSNDADDGSSSRRPKPRSVLFVGDGINDSPALAQAQVGIAIGAGTDVAIESADMVLVRNDLTDLLTAIVLSKHTLHRIKSNFGWSLLYNVLSIPLAAGLLFPFTSMILPPEVAAFAMGCSSVSVVLSSLWLKLFKTPLQSKQDKANKANGSAHSSSNIDNTDSNSVGFDRMPNTKGYIGAAVQDGQGGDHHSIMITTSNNNKSISASLGKKNGQYNRHIDQE